MPSPPASPSVTLDVPDAATVYWPRRMPWRASWATVVGLLCALCAACDSAHVVSQAGMRAYELSLAVEGRRAAVAWHGGLDDHNEIYLQWLDAEGKPISSPLQLTRGREDAYEPDLQLVAGTPILGWYDTGDAVGHKRAWLARFDAQGRLQWRRPLSAAGGAARNPVVRKAANGIAVAWIETPPGTSVTGDAAGAPAPSPQVWAARYDLAGRLLFAPTALGLANANTWNLNAAVDSDEVLHVVYDASIGTRHHELRLAVFAPSGARNLSLSSDDRDAAYPDLRYSDSGRAAITWFDQNDAHHRVYFDVQPQHSLDAGQLLASRPVSDGAVSSFGAYLAWNADRLAIAWCDDRDHLTQVYARSFDGSGHALGPEHPLSRTGARGSIPAVQPWGSGFLVAWNEYRSVPATGHDRILSSVAVTARLQ